MKRPAMTPRKTTHRGPTRGQFLAGVGGLLLLGGCGGTGGGSGESSGSTRTVKHKYGETEVSGDPGRVVTVGFTDQDSVLALGATPVAVREWFGEKPHATWPWAEDELGNAEPEGLPEEQVSLELLPDLGADALFVYTSASGAAERRATDEALRDLRSNPLWLKNEAVREGRSYMVEDHWFGFGVTAADAVLDDLHKRLLEGREG